MWFQMNSPEIKRRRVEFTRYISEGGEDRRTIVGKCVGETDAVRTVRGDDDDVKSPVLKRWRVRVRTGIFLHPRRRTLIPVGLDGEAWGGHISLEGLPYRCQYRNRLRGQNRGRRVL